MRLRYVAELGPRAVGFESANIGDEISFLSLDKIWPDGRFDPTETVEFTGVIGSYNPLNEGDILLPKVSPTFAHGRAAVAHGLTGQRALASSEVFVLRARDGHDSRFLRYRLLSPDFLAGGQAAWTGVAGLKRVSAEFVMNTWIDEQVWQRRRVVADFLDRECERIYAAEATGAAVPRVLSEALADWLRTQSEYTSAPILPLKRLVTRVSDGPFGSSLASSHYVDDPAVRVVRLGNIGRGVFKHDDRVGVSAEYGYGELGAWLLDPGDVVLAALGDANHPLGRAAVVPDDIRPAIHKADCYRLVARPERVISEYLAWALSYGISSDYAPLVGRGATRQRLTTETAREIPVPTPSIRAQEELMRRCQRLRLSVGAASARAEEIRGALAEYRSSLIHEAVTGKLDVSRASESEMDERLHAAAEDRLDEVVA